jgi:hypothetical protein
MFKRNYSFFGRKYKNQADPDKKDELSKEFRQASSRLALRFNIDENRIRNAYKSSPELLKATFKEVSAAAGWRAASAFGSVMALGSVMYLRQLALGLAAAGLVGFFYNQNRISNARKSLESQLEYHKPPRQEPR